jgi:hypothetical protein
MTKMAHQGDIWIRRVNKPKLGAEIARENGKLVLARGESTGHAHEIEAREAKLFAGATPNICYLVAGDTVELLHEEHAPIVIPSGTYEIVRQREYDWQGSRAVAD